MFNSKRVIPGVTLNSYIYIYIYIQSPYAKRHSNTSFIKTPKELT